MVVSIIVIALGGFIVSLYSLFLEYKIKNNPLYEPACNLSDKISCTKPIVSPYGKLLGISNSIIGLIFYSMAITLAIFDLTMLIFCCAIAACLVSVYLAWILYTKIQALCLVCLTIYLINGLLLIVSYLNL